MKKPFIIMMEVPFIGVRRHFNSALFDVPCAFQTGYQEHTAVNAVAFDFGLIDVRCPQPFVGFPYNRIILVIIHSKTSFSGTNGTMTVAESSSVEEVTVVPSDE